MSMDLQLKPSCSGCGSSTDLYGSNCKHMTLCLSCGKTMAENKGKCYDCGAIVTRLIREYNVRASSGNDKNYFIGRFVTGLPDFSKKKSAENKWSLRKDLQGRQLTDAMRVLNLTLRNFGFVNLFKEEQPCAISEVTCYLTLRAKSTNLY